MPEQRPDQLGQRSGQKPQPAAVCTRCGAVSYSPEMINGQCLQVTAGQRCTGVIGSAKYETDWEACPPAWLLAREMRNRAANATAPAGCTSATASGKQRTHRQTKPKIKVLPEDNLVQAPSTPSISYRFQNKGVTKTDSVAHQRGKRTARELEGIRIRTD